jgi:predicted O-methyltransferase YrrM
MVAASNRRLGDLIREQGVLTLGKKAVRHAIGVTRNAIHDAHMRSLVPTCKSRVAALDNDLTSGDAVDFVNNTCSGLIRPAQIRSEIVEFLELIRARKPKTVLEVGTFNGGTLFLFTRVAAPDATLVSLDLPFGMFGGGYPEWKLPLYESFARAQQEVRLVRADSHTTETRERVRAIFGNRRVDFLFIDGDHTYEGVKCDFELYSPLVAEDGLIAFHDIVDGPAEYVGGVHRFWTEVREGYEYREIIDSPDQPYCGIGVLLRRGG